LLTGKKFDPAPLEIALATSQLLNDVVIFGNDRPYPGALLLRSEESSVMADDDLIESIWPFADKLNQGSQDHARLSRNMLIPVPYQAEPLEKSSKGTIIRRAADARFCQFIDGAYDTTYETEKKDVDDAEIPQYLVRIIQDMVPNAKSLEEDADLFSYGVDSIVCMRLRNRLRQLISGHKQDLPLSIVEDSGTVRGLSEYILRKRHGAPDLEDEDEDESMLDLVKKYSSFGNHQSALKASNQELPVNGKHGEVVVLTGATGALGAHILDLLRKSNTVSTIYCLVRGADENAAEERVNKALQQRGLADLSTEDKPNVKVKVVQAQLGDPRLGLSDAVYDYLAAEATLILHIAWTVNFRLKLRSFAKDNIAGVMNLINLALAAGRTQSPRFAFCSSTAAIINDSIDHTGALTETLPQSPSSATALGYSRSKWVAEQICAEAHNRTLLRGKISVIRVGQLSGDSNTGIWNTKEAWPMMLSTSRLIGCLPNLGDEPLDWLPVNIAAEAFLQVCQSPTNEAKELPLYHILNPHQRPTWHEMLQWFKKKEDFSIVSPQEWVRRLEQSNDSDHSAMKLLGLWKEAYSHAPQEKTNRPQFSIIKTQEQVPALRDLQPLTEAYMSKIWEWIQANVY
jgi:thioester reductase-like protein